MPAVVWILGALFTLPSLAVLCGAVVRSHNIQRLREAEAKRRTELAEGHRQRSEALRVIGYHRAPSKRNGVA